MKLISPAWVLLISGLLLIAVSEEPGQWIAVIGFICTTLGAVGLVWNFAKSQGKQTEVTLSPDEQEALRDKLNNDGLVAAVNQLRDTHPEITLSQAKKLLMRCKTNLTILVA